MDLYSATSQIIPVLLLALVFESRFLESIRQARGANRRVLRGILLTVLAAAAVGEVTSLAVLSANDTAPGLKYVVVVAVLLLLAGLSALILELAPRRPHDEA